MAAKLVGKVSFINVGLEGTRNTTNHVRGDYASLTPSPCRRSPGASNNRPPSRKIVTPTATSR